MGAVIDGDLAPVGVRRRNISIKRKRILRRGGLVTKQASAAAPGRIVVAGRNPGGAEVGAAGVVIFPGVRDGQQRQNQRRDVRDGDSAVRSGIGAARGRLREADERIAAAGRAALGDIRLLGSVVDHVNRGEGRIREENDAHVGIELEVEVVSTLGGIAIGDK